jgi:GNAT superfamily N-acetyltransferase
MVRLVPLTEAEFRESFERAVVRHASDSVHRGVWTKEGASEASRKELGGYLPQGRETDGHHFVKVVDESNGKQVGEAWYFVREEGGKVRFWVDWLWTDPAQRRRGYATAVLQQLSHEAAKRGADRIGLNVFLDNPHALALYTKLGFTNFVVGMSRPVKL